MLIGHLGHHDHRHEAGKHKEQMLLDENCPSLNFSIARMELDE
jgi:hypothetical protein